MISYSEFTHNWTTSFFKYVEPISEDYRVIVNGQEIPVYTCRISKYSFNRVWPQHQRPIDQTMVVSFVNIVSDEELNIDVVPNIPYEEILIKPYSKKIEYEEKDGKISFTLKTHGGYVFEPGSAQNSLYIFNSKPVVAPDKNDVTYYFGPGIHMPGKIMLKDNESIYVDKDALVFGCVFAEKANNIRIFGNGLFDDSGEERFCVHCYEDYTNGNMKFYECKNLSIEGVLMRNSAIWCLNLFNCFDVVVDDIKIFGQWRYNTDGIDIVNSQNILIKNSFIHSFDDTITIKGIDRYIQTDNVNIITENCVLWCDWGRACEVGIETACREYRNIVFRNCDVLRAGSNALDIQNGDCAEISNVLFENINVEYNSFDSPEVYQNDDSMVYNKANEITIPNLIFIGNYRFRSEEAVKLWGLPSGLMVDLDLEGIKCASVHDVEYRDINVYYDEKIPLKDGIFNVPIRIKSDLEDVEYYNISISGITVNGVKIDENNAVMSVENVKNFCFNAEDDFSQMKKNNVSSANQLKASEYVTFENPNGKGKRIMFVGNSITRHGVLHEIGWHHNWGMAASAKEKDYVHQTIGMVQKCDKDAAFCLCQLATWERQYKNGSETHHMFEAARDFDADIIVFRFIENCPGESFDTEAFKTSLSKLADFLSPSKKAKIIITTGFWKHPGDKDLRAFAAENNMPCVELGDLGEMNEMKAIGLFTHDGVANHPGDLGMTKIAERIFAVMEQML